MSMGGAHPHAAGTAIGFNCHRVNVAWRCGNCYWSGVRGVNLLHCPVCDRSDGLTVLSANEPDGEEQQP